MSRNLCQAHYNKAAHPLKTTWKLLRSRWPGQYPKEWDSFEVFHRTVGDRPSPHHQLRRRNPLLPYSRDNFRWLERIYEAGRTIERERRVRGWTLRSKFDISLADYEQRLEEQGGVCAICRQPETGQSKETGKSKRLSVDHNHASGQVRGLLCVNCNRALGYFKDSPERLKAALEYLVRSRA